MPGLRSCQGFVHARAPARRAGVVSCARPVTASGPGCRFCLRVIARSRRGRSAGRDLRALDLRPQGLVPMRSSHGCSNPGGPGPGDRHSGCLGGPGQLSPRANPSLSGSALCRLASVGPDAQSQAALRGSRAQRCGAKRLLRAHRVSFFGELGALQLASCSIQRGPSFVGSTCAARLGARRAATMHVVTLAASRDERQVIWFRALYSAFGLLK